MIGSLVLALAIAAENRLAGSADWEISRPALHREIEGYASRTSVNRGDTIDLFVSSADPHYTVDLFRMGWYGGAGARRVAQPIERDGFIQTMPVPDASTGLIECRWRDPYTVRTADAYGAWTTGVYLARLTARPSGVQSFIVFVVRDDESTAPLLFQSSVTTFAAYNNWGGQSLYAFNSGNTPARIVSFDRPYAGNPYGVRLDGAGDFLRRWEYNAVRFLEREGYEIAYSTDVDTHERAGSLLRHAVFLSVGHDEVLVSGDAHAAWRPRATAGCISRFSARTRATGRCVSSRMRQALPTAASSRTRRAPGDRDPLAIDGDPSERSVGDRALA